MYTIHHIKAREVLDSRGNPTVEAEVKAGTITATAIVPSGASTGLHEALELRDKDKRYHGLGVQKAVKNINLLIAPKLKGKNVTHQPDLDFLMVELDGTYNKGRLGANAILAVSLACARAAATAQHIPLYEHLGRLCNNTKFVLPVPFANIINGGKHAGTQMKFQEFMIVPVKAKSFSEATRMVSETYHALKDIIKKRFGPLAINVGDEGGFAPPIRHPEEALNLICQAIKQTGYSGRIKLAIDAAASEFYKNEQYMGIPKNKFMLGYMKLLKHYPIISLEDPFDQDDFESYRKFMPTAKKYCQVVGDDLTATSLDRIHHAINESLCNALLLKVNQIGTVTEAIAAARLARQNGWQVMVANRSGETEDTFIAELAVALGCGQIKLGAPCRGERTAKYNRLIRIEEELGKKARYARL